MFHGSDCAATSVLVQICYFVLLLLSLYILLTAIHSFIGVILIDRQKRKEEGEQEREKENRFCKCTNSLPTRTASVAANLCSIVAVAAIGCVCGTNFIRSMNIGNQNIAAFFMVPLSTALASAFTNTSLMTVCFLWLELSLFRTKKQRMVKLAKNTTFCAAILLFVVNCGVYSWTEKPSYVFVVCFISELPLVFGFWRTPTLLSQRLVVHQPRIRRANRIASLKKKYSSKVFLSPGLDLEGKTDIGFHPNKKRGSTFRMLCVVLTTGLVQNFFQFNQPTPENETLNIHETAKKVQDFANAISQALSASLLFSALYMVTYHFPDSGAAVCVFALLTVFFSLLVHHRLLSFLKSSH